ncbi:MAG: response regulator transcription factor [Pelolinea sp.]|nr:response regulator transcription factor [Pelolinea sp.]
MPKKKILIVDDHKRITKDFSRFISQEPDFEICGIFKSVSEFKSSIINIKPDLIVMDLYLPEKEGDLIDYSPINVRGLKIGFEYKTANPNVKILFTTLNPSPEVISMIDNSSHSGIGFVYKDVDDDDFIHEIRTLIKGIKHSIDGISRELIKSDQSFRNELINLFTERERKVLELVALGKPQTRIAKELYCSSRYVGEILNQIRGKLEDKNISIGGNTRPTLPQLTHLAILLGLTPLLSPQKDTSYKY